MKTFLDWSSYENAGVGDAYADIPKHGGDFAKAVAVCINSRHCEEKGKGVMCPSFRISDDPLLSTGGRVRLLKAVLNSDDVPLALNDGQLAQAMDLCVACKGCKRECENEVDMAMIKMEYLAQRHAQTAVSLRTRLFANLPEHLSRYPWLKKLIALRNASPFLAALLQRWLGISAQRKLPLPVDKPFLRQHEVTVSTPGKADEGKLQVVLFVDTFSQNFEPGNAEAAKAVLEHAGYTVHVPRPPDTNTTPLCCGRTQLAHGLIDQARRKAEWVLAALQPYVEQGMPIIGLEPACLLAIRDDYKFLGLGELAEKTARQAVLFEEFIAKEQAAKRLTLTLATPPEMTAPVLVHGHCHQKAVGAMKSMRKVLKLIPGLDFDFIESSCCGMAGSFGLEAEHREASLAMAEESLLPSVREHPHALIVANGFSCRHQIEECNGRKPVHLAVLLLQSIQAAVPDSGMVPASNQA